MEDRIWFPSKVTRAIVVSEIEEARCNDCDTLVIVCANGWTSGADDAAEDEEDIDVHLVFLSDDIREQEDY